MASLIYDSFRSDILNGNIDLTDDTIKIALVTSSYTPVQATHNFFDDVTNEVSGTGYTAGGATLGSKVVSVTSNVAKFDATDPSWTTSTITARGAVIYKSTGNSATSNLICYIDFGQDYTSAAGTLQITFNASGILTIT